MRTLLRVLAVRRPDLVPHDALAEALWPDRLPADPVANLNVLVNRARRALGDPALIVTGTGGYALGDVHGRRRGVPRRRWPPPGRAADPASAVRAGGVRRWRCGASRWPRTPTPSGPASPGRGCCAPGSRRWSSPRRAALALGDPARGRRVRGRRGRRRAAAGARSRCCWPGRWPRTGDRAGALARLAELRRRLADELGIDPSPDVAAAAAGAAARRRLRHRRRCRAGSRPAVRRAARSSGGTPSWPGCGRCSPRAAWWPWAGVAGVGKSRLLAEALRDAAGAGASRRPAFLPERAEAWGLARSLLREALAVDAAVADGAAGPRPRRPRRPAPRARRRAGHVLDGESRRALVLAGGLRVLEAVTRRRRRVLVVDDLQWADPSSLALLGSVLARLPRLAAVLALPARRARRPGSWPSCAAPAPSPS